MTRRRVGRQVGLHASGFLGRPRHLQEPADQQSSAHLAAACGRPRISRISYVPFVVSMKPQMGRSGKTMKTGFLVMTRALQLINHGTVCIACFPGPRP